MQSSTQILGSSCLLLQVVDLDGGECILDFGNRGAIDCVASSVAEDEGVPTDVQLLRVTRGD